MARDLTVKQRWVLARIIAEPWETMREIAEASPKRVDGEKGWPAVSYQEVVVAVKRLLDRGLIERDPGRPPYRHGPTSLALEVGDDPLEQAFAAPPAEVDR